MPMDEVIRAIEQVDSENMQDVLDAVIARYQELYADRLLAVMSLPREDRDERRRQMRKTMELIEEI